MNALDVDGKTFLMGVRGYVRTEVDLFLLAVADELRKKDEELMTLRQKVGKIDRKDMITSLGAAASTILAGADEAAEAIRADASREVQKTCDALRAAVTKLAETQDQLNSVVQNVEESLALLQRISLPSAASGPVADPEAKTSNIESILAVVGD